jgi:nitronate monooxygenase
MVTSAADARRVESSGVDVVVAQGVEAGGHRSHFVKPAARDLADLGTMALVPEVVDAVSVPVAAAGGIVDGRGLVAALALGASGVLLGTRFLMTRESIAPEAHKKRILEQRGDDTVLTDTISGRYARVLRNELTERYHDAGAPVLPFPSQLLASADVRGAAEQRDDADHLPLWCGQSAGRLSDLPWAGDVVRDLIALATSLIGGRLADRVRR